MQLTNILPIFAMAMAISAAAAPAPDANAAEGPYLKVRDPGCEDRKRNPSSCGYTYIKKSEVPELISRDVNNEEEAFLKGSSLIQLTHIDEGGADID